MNAREIAALRRRGKGEVRRLYSYMVDAGAASGDPEARAARVEAIATQIGDIRQAIAGTYVRGRNSQERAQESARDLRRIVGSPIGKNETRAQQRESQAQRLFAENLRRQRHGEEAPLFTGDRAEGQQEAIFYAATQEYWYKVDPDKRDQAIIKALGVSNLEEAYDKVMQANREALSVSAAGGVVSGKRRRGSGEWIDYINFV